MNLYEENYSHLSPVWTHNTPIVVDHALGSLVYDQNGDAYLDFTCGIGVTASRRVPFCTPRRTF
jgi:4-aminobutyrate aminotransferase-like enzyme